MSLYPLASVARAFDQDRSMSPERATWAIIRPGIDREDEFLAFMTKHKDPTRLSDEFFAVEHAPEFIPPVGVEHYVALGPAGPVDSGGQPTGTWVRRYARWRYDGKKLKQEAVTCSWSIAASTNVERDVVVQSSRIFATC